MRRIAIAGMIIVLLLLAVFGIRYPLVASADGSAGPWTDGDEWYATFEYQGEIYAFSHAYTEAYWTTVVGEAFANQANAAPDGNAGDKGQAWCNDVLVTEGPDNQYDDWFLPNFDELLAGRNDYEGGDPLDVDPPALCHDYANMGLRALWTANTCYQGATGAERAYFLYPLSSWVDDSGAPGYLHCENEGTDSHWCCFDKENYGIVHTCPLVRCVRVISDEPTPIPPTPTAPPTVSPEPTDTPTPTPPPQQTELQLPALTVADDTVFSVPLTIENAVELEGWTAEFSYDPEVISRTLQVVFTSFLGGDPVGPEFEDGTVSLGQYGSGEPASGDGVLAFVEFLALRPGTTDLTFGETGLLGPGGWQPHATRDGYVVVIGGVPPSPTPTNTPTPLPPTDTPTPLPPTETPTPLPPTDTPTPLPPTETPTSTDTPTPTVVSPIDTPTATVVSPIETPTPTYPSSPVGEEPQRGVPLAAGMPLLALLLAVVTWGPARGSLAALAQRFWRGH